MQPFTVCYCSNRAVHHAARHGANKVIEPGIWPLAFGDFKWARCRYCALPKGVNSNHSFVCEQLHLC